MKTPIVVILICTFVFLLTGCAYNQEEVDSMVSEASASAYEEGYGDAQLDLSAELSNEYDRGYEDGIDAVMDTPEDYFPSDWAYVPTDAYQEYLDKMEYYSTLCNYYGLPEYFPDWDEFTFVHYVPPQEDDLPRKWYVPGEQYYHDFAECAAITSAKKELISKNEAVVQGLEPCPICEK